MEHGSISTEQCSISTEQGSIFTYQGSILCRRVPFQWVRVPFLWRRIPLIWRRFHCNGVWFHVYRATTRYYHQQPPRGTFCSPRAHTFLFVVKFRPNNGWWFYENVRAHPTVLLGVTLFKGIYRQVVMCQTCSVVPVLIWFHFVSLKRL